MPGARGVGEGGGETYEEQISPKKAFSLPISGSVFVNSVCALAKCLKGSGVEEEPMFGVVVVFSVVRAEVRFLTVLRREPIGVSGGVLEKGFPIELVEVEYSREELGWVGERGR